MPNSINEIKQINIEDILPNRSQPRINFDEKKLNELADSIKKYGIIQPLVVRKLDNKYEIIAGERRLKAAYKVNLKVVPAVILEIDDKTASELAIIENLQRENLNPIELAKSYQNLTNYEPKEKISESLSKQENVIENKIKLLNLPIEIQNALQNNEISEGHAKLLLSVKDENKQKELLNRITKEKIAVSSLSEIIKNDTPIPEVNEIDINPNMQKALSGINLVDKKSETFNDTNKEIVEGKNMDNNMDKTQMINIDEIKSAAQDINKEEPTADLNNLLKIEKGYEPVKPVEEKPKFSFAGKFFPSLEDESANMDIGSNFTNNANNVEISFPNIGENSNETINPINEEQPIPQNTVTSQATLTKDENVVMPNTMEMQKEEVTSIPPYITPNIRENNQETKNPINEEQPILENVVTTEPTEINNNVNNNVEEPFINEYNEQEEQPITNNAPSLRNAINMSRDLANKLESIGFNIDLEELDLQNEYQVIIKIQK